MLSFRWNLLLSDRIQLVIILKGTPQDDNVIRYTAFYPILFPNIISHERVRCFRLFTESGSRLDSWSGNTTACSRKRCRDEFHPEPATRYLGVGGELARPTTVRLNSDPELFKQNNTNQSRFLAYLPRSVFWHMDWLAISEPRAGLFWSRSIVYPFGCAIEMQYQWPPLTTDYLNVVVNRDILLIWMQVPNVLV